jgi:magnesium-transporting ATPase (P-type)
VSPFNRPFRLRRGGDHVLCFDNPGTLTRNKLSVNSVRQMSGFDEAHVLALASLASVDGVPTSGRRRGSCRYTEESSCIKGRQHSVVPRREIEEVGDRE